MSIRSYMDIINKLNEPLVATRIDEFNLRDALRRKRQPAVTQPAETPPANPSAAQPAPETPPAAAPVSAPAAPPQTAPMPSSPPKAPAAPAPVVPQQATPAAPQTPQPSSEPAAPQPAPPPPTRAKSPAQSMINGLQHAISKRDYKKLLQRLQLGKQTFPKFDGWFRQQINDAGYTQAGEDWTREQAWDRLNSKLTGTKGVDILKAFSEPDARNPRK